MKNQADIFKGKRITLMGLGLLGRGVGDAAFLAENGAQLTVTDLKSELELSSSLESLQKYTNIQYTLGKHDLEDFRNADLIIKAAGVPLDSPYIIEAEKNGVPVTMSTALFAEYTPATIVGVTGTRGKSTVAYLLYEIFKEHAKKTNKKVFLGGNVLGVSTLALLPETSAGDIVVLELDSWQLQGFAGTHHRKLSEKLEGFSPTLSVFTTFMPDHMNYYDNDMERYFADKANIYRFQNTEDTLVVSAQVADYMKKYGPKPQSQVVITEAQNVPDSWQIQIPGEHNALNVALALAAAKALGVSEKTVHDVVEKFKAVPGRLELIRKLKGVEIYNDTNATTQDATIVGLKALGNDQKTILIFGGADKKLAVDDLLVALPEYAKALVVLPGTGTEKIKQELEKISKSKNIPVTFVTSMKEAVQIAWSQALPGDRILMSPAFASFGLFKNEYDRGDQFVAAVKRLQ